MNPQHRTDGALRAPELPRVVVFGEALTDLIQVEPGQWVSRQGGACWNVARALASLGVATGFAGCVSAEGHGEEIAALTAAAGLDLRFLQQSPQPPLLAHVYSQNPPRYTFSQGHTAEQDFDPAGLPQGWLVDAQWVHFGSISLVRQPLGGRLLALARAARAAGKRISFDPNWRNLMDASYLPTFFEMVRLADDIKISDEDLQQLLPDQSAAASLQQLAQLNPRARILYTRGELGITLHAGEARISQPAFAVEVADTIGAGDASIAGWIAANLRAPDAGMAQALEFAAAAAAVACMGAGAHPPALADVTHLLEARA